MKKSVLILFIVVFSTNGLFSEEVEAVIVKRFLLGSTVGQLGFKKEFIGTGEPYGPRALVAADSTLRILDIFNNKIVVYDLDGEYINEIILKNPEAFLFSITMKANDGYCFYETNEGIGVFTGDGNFVYKVPEEKLSDQVKYLWNFFLLRNNLVLYNYNKINNLEVYNDTGEKLSEEDIALFIDSIYDTAIYDKNELINNTVIEFAKNNGFLVEDGKLLSSDFEVHRKMFNILQQKVNIRDAKRFERDIFEAIRLIGFDNDSNSYWSCRSSKDVNKIIVIICSKFGQIINYFNNPLNERRVAVSEYGDLYYLHVFKGGIELWKTERSW